MYNTQEDITIKLTETLEKTIALNKKLLKNLIAIIIGMIVSGSSIPADIAPELKSSYSKGALPSIVKRIKRFLNTEIKVDLVYHLFIKYIIKKYKPSNNTITIIIDHTTCEDRFMILQFAMKIGRRAIPIWFKIFKYEDKDNQSRKHVKEGLAEIKELFSHYNYEIVILADRAFRDIALFKFIGSCHFKFAIRIVGNTIVKIPNKRKIRKLEDIKIKVNQRIFFKNVKLTESEFVCNVGIAVDKEDGDVWYIVSNMSPKRCLRMYATRFTIEEMFKDFKSNGFNLEGTATNNLTYFKNLYFCICIASIFLITIGSSCTKDKRNKIIGAVRKTKENKFVRVYSLFKTGLKWFKMCYYSDVTRYLKCDFVLYHC